MIPELVLDWPAVGALLQRHRDAQRMNLTDLAASAGVVDKNTLSRLARGGIVEADTLFWIVPWLGVTPAYFYRADVFAAGISPPPRAPIARLVDHVAAAGRAAIEETVQAVGLAGDLVTQVHTVATQAISRAILTPLPTVFGGDLLAPIRSGLVIDWPAFGQAVRERRGNESRVDAAASIGAISDSSLRRLEPGGIATAEMLFRLCLWLPMSPDHFYRATALLALPSPHRPVILRRLAEQIEKTVRAAVEAALTARGLQGALVTRLATTPAQAASQALLTAPADMFPLPPPDPTA